MGEVDCEQNHVFTKHREQRNVEGKNSSEKRIMEEIQCPSES